MQPDFRRVPIVDVGAMIATDASDADRQRAARAIDDAFRNAGFMYITNHGIDMELLNQARSVTRKFFLQSQPVKDEIAM